MFLEWVDQDAFKGQDGLVFFFEFSAALGCSDFDPVGGAVAGAGEPLPFDEGFQKDGAVAVAGEPVGGDAPGKEGEKAGGEVAGLHPRWDQKAVVVDDQVQAGTARRVGPTDEVIPRGNEPGAGSEAQSPNDFAAAASEVAELSAGHRAGSQVMMGLQELVVDGAVGLGLHDVQADIAELLRTQGDEALRQGQEHPGIGFLAALGSCSLRRGQDDESGAVHAQQRDFATHGFEFSRRIDPVKLLADPPREMFAAERFFRDPGADGFQFLLREVAPAKPAIRGRDRLAHGEGPGTSLGRWPVSWYSGLFMRPASSSTNGAGSARFGLSTHPRASRALLSE